MARGEDTGSHPGRQVGRDYIAAQQLKPSTTVAPNSGTTQPHRSMQKHGPQSVARAQTYKSARSQGLDNYEANQVTKEGFAMTPSGYQRDTRSWTDDMPPAKTQATAGYRQPLKRDRYWESPKEWDEG